jgi:hypothetical protein
MAAMTSRLTGRRVLLIADPRIPSARPTDPAVRRYRLALARLQARPSRAIDSRKIAWTPR